MESSSKWPMTALCKRKEYLFLANRRRYNSKKKKERQVLPAQLLGNSYDQSLSKINDAETIYLHGR